MLRRPIVWYLGVGDGWRGGSRFKLGRLAFNDPSALQLKNPIHPYVLQAIDYFIQRTIHQVVVIEAIKLIESGLAGHCNSLWAVYAPPEVQLRRLMQHRKMSEAMPRQRTTPNLPRSKSVPYRPGCDLQHRHV